MVQSKLFCGQLSFLKIPFSPQKLLKIFFNDAKRIIHSWGAYGNSMCTSVHPKFVQSLSLDAHKVLTSFISVMGSQRPRGVQCSRIITLTLLFAELLSLAYLRVNSFTLAYLQNRKYIDSIFLWWICGSQEKCRRHENHNQIYHIYFQN